MKKVLNPVGMFVIGLLLGIISRLFDIYFQNLGNMFPKELRFFQEESQALVLTINVSSRAQSNVLVTLLYYLLAMINSFYKTKKTLEDKKSSRVFFCLNINLIIVDNQFIMY